ncbi:MAG: hybrid sensor histidine kinase/response regulator, partial [Lachnospiraceae bacterium]|nr:hybrid sensor histidine kinase/response regulator [Lachnospiraceae bacterium]
YTIQVHALKSSARLIGAFAFSEEALALETAGREGDTEKIRKDTEGILKKYEWFYEQLDEIFGEKENGDDDREAISEDELKERLSEMAELLEAFDFDTAKELFDTFADVRLPDDFKEIYGEMKTKMAELDRDGMLALISGGSEDD